MKNETSLLRKTSTKTIAKIGVLSAVAAVIMIFEFPLFFAPMFYKIDLSEIPVLMGAFALGPLAGVIIEIIKILLNLLLNGSTTVGVGEFANLVVGCAFIVPSAIIYRKNKSLKKAIIALVVGIISLTVIGTMLNYYLLIPFYSTFMPIDEIIAAGAAVNKFVVDKFTLVVFAVAPFNFIKGTIVSVITLLLYKKISPILHK